MQTTGAGPTVNSPAAPPPAAARPPLMLVPLAAGALLLAASSLCFLSAFLDVTGTLSGIPPGSRLYQDMLGATALRSSLSLAAAACLIISGVLAVAKRGWDAAYVLVLAAVAFEGMANVPHKYDEFLNTGSLPLSVIGLLLAIFGGVMLASCRRDFWPWLAGGLVRHPGRFLGFGMPRVPFFPPGDRRPQKYLLSESGREAAGTLMFLAGLLVLASVTGTLRRAGNADIPSEELMWLWLYCALLVAGAAAALAAGGFSTVRKIWYLTVPAGIAAVLLVVASLISVTRVMPGGRSILWFTDEQIFLESLSAVIYLVIATIVAGAMMGADRATLLPQGSR